MAYRWTLRKGGRKERCPQCGKMRFVPFVLTDDPSVKAGPEYGRCDREQSCGYFRYPGRDVIVAGGRGTTCTEELPPMRFTRELAENAAVEDSNSLFRAYARLLGADTLRVVMEEYHCGTAGIANIYWQFDGEAVRTGKAIIYSADGHRQRGGDGETLPVWWWHKTDKVAAYAQNHRLQQCLFGAHLLRQADKAKDKVYIVEGEKTAVLMAAADRREGRGGRLWLACGGSQMLKGAVSLSPLIGRRVTLIPDDGQYWNWVRVANTYGWGCIDIEPQKKALGLPDGVDIWDVAEVAMRGGRE